MEKEEGGTDLSKFMSKMAMYVIANPHYVITRRGEHIVLFDTINRKPVMCRHITDFDLETKTERRN